MAFDPHKNFAYSTINTAPTPAVSGLSLIVAAGEGARFPATPFNATIWPTASLPLVTNAEIVRVISISTDTFTIVRSQESSTARTIVVGDQIAATITAKTFSDIETGAAFLNVANVFTETQSITKSSNSSIGLQISNPLAAGSAIAQVKIASDTTTLWELVYSGSVSALQYGLSLAGAIHIFGDTANWLLIGTGANNSPIIFGNNSVERMRLHAGGGLSLGTTTDPGSGAFVLTGIHYLNSGQIKFPATANPSGDVNTFDDYEEGTWTPSFGGSGGQSGQVHASQFGIYTKIGKHVYVQANVALSTVGTLTGSVVIKGLPFVAANNAARSSAHFGYFVGLTASISCLSGYIAANDTAITLMTIAAAGAGGTLGVGQATIGAGSDFIFSAHYQSSS